MPIVKVYWTAKKTRDEKKEFCEFVAGTLEKHSGTKLRNVYVYITEWDEENVRQTAPVATIDWVADEVKRNPEAKKKIMVDLTDRLCEMTGEAKEAIVILFTDIIPHDAAQGGFTRSDFPVTD